MVQKPLCAHLYPLSFSLSFFLSLSVLPFTDQLMQGNDLNGVQVGSRLLSNLITHNSSLIPRPVPRNKASATQLRIEPNVHDVGFLCKDHSLQCQSCVCMQILEEERPWLGRARREVESQAKRMLLQGLELMVSYMLHVCSSQRLIYSFPLFPSFCPLSLFPSPSLPSLPLFFSALLPFFFTLTYRTPPRWVCLYRCFTTLASSPQPSSLS